MDAGEQAALEAAARRVKRAAGQLRDAQRDLAALADGGQTVLGTQTVHDADSARTAHELVSMGVGRYGAVDVIVIARTRRRKHTPPTAPTRGEGEEANGNQDPPQEGP